MARVEPSGLRQQADRLNQEYNRLSSIKDNLEALHTAIHSSWEDNAEKDFTQKFEKGMDSLWDLMVAMDSMEGYLRQAAEGYENAEKLIKTF